MGSRFAIDASPLSSASRANAVSMRVRRVAGEGVDRFVGTKGCLDRNSAKTRLTIEAQVGMSVRYSGLPESRMFFSLDITYTAKAKKSVVSITSYYVNPCSAWYIDHVLRQSLCVS